MNFFQGALWKTFLHGSAHSGALYSSFVFAEWKLCHVFFLDLLIISCVFVFFMEAR